MIYQPKEAKDQKTIEKNKYRPKTVNQEKIENSKESEVKESLESVKMTKD